MENITETALGLQEPYAMLGFTRPPEHKDFILSVKVKVRVTQLDFQFNNVRSRDQRARLGTGVLSIHSSHVGGPGFRHNKTRSPNHDLINRMHIMHVRSLANNAS